MPARSGKVTYTDTDIQIKSISAPAVLLTKGKELANLQNRATLAETRFA
jgi:hypothetical protein